jgi:hypothetical protein
MIEPLHWAVCDIAVSYKVHLLSASIYNLVLNQFTDMRGKDVELGGNDVMEVDPTDQSHEAPSVNVLSSVRNGRNSFPLSEIDEKSPHFKCIYEALSKVVRDNEISELDLASSTHSDFFFWVNALDNIGIKLDLGIANQFYGLSNGESFRIFSRLVEEYFSQRRATRSGEPPSRERSFFSQEFKQKRYAQSAMRLITDYSRMYTDETFHSPYASLVQASMTGKSRLVKEMAQSVYCIHVCLRGPGQLGYPEPRFYEFFRAFPIERSKRIKQFVFFFGIMVKRLTALLKEAKPYQPSDFWEYQEDHGIEYEKKVADEVAECMKKYRTREWGISLPTRYLTDFQASRTVATLGAKLRLWLRTMWNNFERSLSSDY